MGDKRRSAGWTAKTMGVLIEGDIRRRIEAYLATQDGLKKKALFNQALDEYLKKRGA